MRVRKIIILLISILFPLIVTPLLPLFLTAPVGGWGETKSIYEHYSITGIPRRTNRTLCSFPLLQISKERH